MNLILECRNSSEAFRLLLTSVSQRLRPENLSELKYQCRDHIGQGTLEKINTFLELFAVLEERDVVSEEDVSFLHQCLNHIYRKDLAKYVAKYTDRWVMPSTQVHHRATKHFNDVVQFQGRTSKDFSAPCDIEPTSNLFFVDDVDKNMYKTEARPFATERYVPQISYATRRRTEQLPELVWLLISFMAENLSVNWRETLRHLGIQDEIIDAANYNWPNDIKRQISESLEYWIRHGGVLTTESAIEAARITGRVDLADKLRGTFGQH